MTVITARMRQLTPYEIRRFVVVACACFLAAVGALIAAHNVFADNSDNGNNSTTNQATAINTENGSNAFDLAFQILTVDSSVVAPTNMAYAYSSCTACSTVAIAVQIVFVVNPQASVITPQNYAVAVNYACSSCQTYAAAYQWVISVPGPVTFTPEGKRELKRIEAELRDLRDCNCNVSNAQLAPIMAQLQLVLQTDVVPVENGPNEEKFKHDEQQSTPTPEASPSESPSPSTAPSGSPTPSSSPSDLGTPSPSPTT